MIRLAVFFASVATTVACIGALDWWVDPFADRYRSDAVAAALGHAPQCLISHDVVGERTWPDFKLDLVRRRHARIVVIGTSRVWKLPARSPDEPFANLAIPGMGIETLNPLLHRLAGATHSRLTIELGLEEFWLSSERGEAFFDDTVVDDVRLIVSGQTLKATLATLRRAPGAIRHPAKLRPWQLTQLAHGCLVDRDQSVLRGASNAWGADGTWQWQWDVTGAVVPQAKRYVLTHRDDFLGAAIEPHKLRLLRAALAFARARRWRLIAFAPPYTSDSIAYLRRDRGTAGLWRDYARRIPSLVASYGYRFVDLSDVHAVPCDDREFTWNDGAHADDRCSASIRKHVEAALRERS